MGDFLQGYFGNDASERTLGKVRSRERVLPGQARFARGGEGVPEGT